MCRWNLQTTATQETWLGGGSGLTPEKVGNKLVSVNAAPRPDLPLLCVFPALGAGLGKCWGLNTQLILGQMRGR